MTILPWPSLACLAYHWATSFCRAARSHAVITRIVVIIDGHLRVNCIWMVGKAHIFNVCCCFNPMRFIRGELKQSLSKPSPHSTAWSDIDGVGKFARLVRTNLLHWRPMAVFHGNLWVLWPLSFEHIHAPWLYYGYNVECVDNGIYKYYDSNMLMDVSVAMTQHGR